MTLKEAAITILSEASSPLTAHEIHEAIVDRDLFTFRGQSGSLGPVTATLKRHAAGAHSCTPAKTKAFQLVQGDRYQLKG